MSADQPSGTVDFVIVGAGSAGCVLANRLSAGDHTVLVLEAGRTDDALEIPVPAAFSELFKTDHDWDYATEPQQELAGRELYWPRGKGLGGSSSINAAIHVRGHPDDYDAWAAMGNDGWAWDDVLPYFKRLEADSHGSRAFHGRRGPMHVHRPEPHELATAWIDAAQAAGIPYNHDFNGERLAGAGTFPVNVKDGERHSAADGYLKPALSRSTLTAETGAHVTRIRFDDHEAAAVEYEQDGTLVTVGAEREVIVAAGAVNSPALLMRSGLGPADHLREHGIDVVCDLPGVGRNLQDHLQVPVIYRCIRPATLDDAKTLWNVLQYVFLKRGPLTSNVAEAGAFLHTDDSRVPPDLEVHFGRAYFERHGFENDGDRQAISMVPTLLTPESTGRITLRSASPSRAPAIDPQYLTADADLDRLVAGIRVARRIARQPPLETYRGAEIVPADDPTTDEALATHVRENARTLYHPVGTCRMGGADDAVVDDHLRVHGVAGLRVVDASVMPTIPRGNTNVPTIMIAERASDLIRDAHH